MEDIAVFKCPYIDKATIWEKADSFRREHWPDQIIPIDIEKIIEKKLNLHVEPTWNLSNSFDTDAYLRNDLSGIIVDYERYMNDKYINRLRFSFAHEIGHLVLHKEIYQNFQINSPQELIIFMREIPDKEYSLFEYQANEFAGRLLVPVESLIIELKKCLKLLPLYDMQDLLDKDPDMVLVALSPALCKSFGVSEQVIGIRVEREGLWPPGLD